MYVEFFKNPFGPNIPEGVAQASIRALSFNLQGVFSEGLRPLLLFHTKGIVVEEQNAKLSTKPERERKSTDETEVIKMTKPKVFIGSSSEGLDVARSLKHELSDVAKITLWNEGVFALSRSYLESLIEALDSFDFAILIFRADDVVTSRAISSSATRGNVLFELGLFMGRLGRSRTFVVYDTHKQPNIISDSSVYLLPHMIQVTLMILVLPAMRLERQ